jgi:hypothetical protein
VGADVLAGVGLGWQPVGATLFHDDVPRALVSVQPAGTQHGGAAARE